MNNPVSAASPTDRRTSPGAADETRALRTGLELARASQLTMLRLQLALHKSNRRTAMQALDHLLDIDAEMEDLAATLNGVPIHPASDAALSGFIGLQKAAIAAEKHALTGGQPQADGALFGRPMTLTALQDRAADGDPLLPDGEEANDDRTGSRRRVSFLAVAIVMILIGIGLTLYLSPTLAASLASLLESR